MNRTLDLVAHTKSTQLLTYYISNLHSFTFTLVKRSSGICCKLSRDNRYICLASNVELNGFRCINVCDFCTK